MKKLRVPHLVTVAIFTTITIVFWVFYSLYGILTSDSFQEVPPEILASIDPTLDTKALDKLPGRLFFEEGEVEAFTLPESASSETVETQVPTPTEASEVSESTASASLTITPTPFVVDE